MISLRIKFLISLCSFLLFLGFLELGLRIGGSVFQKLHDDEYREDELFASSKEVGKKGTTRIVCIGDSFTHGGMVKGDKTYPALLGLRLKNKNNKDRFLVLNKGVCELNTHELLQRLPDLVKEYHPDIIILLAGSANRFNPWGYEAHKQKNISSSLKSFFFGFRVVKMARIIWLNLKMRRATFEISRHISSVFADLRNPETCHDLHAQYIAGCEKINPSTPLRIDAESGTLFPRPLGGAFNAAECINYPIPDEPLRALWYYHNTGKTKEAIEKCKEALVSGSAGKEDFIMALAHFYFKEGQLKETEDLLVNAYAEFPRSERIIESMAYYYFEFANWYKRAKRYNDAIKYYLKAISVDPNADYFYYEMTKVYELQSYYDSRMIYSELRRMQENDPLLATSKMFTNYLSLYSDKQKWEADVEEWIYHDLKEAVSLCKRHNIRLLIQNYPVSYVMANRVLKSIADQYSLSFVDNLSVFKTLEPRNKYLFDDDHCTVEGHNIIAENIYKALMEKKLVNP